MEIFTAETARSMFVNKTEEILNKIVHTIKIVAPTKDFIVWDYDITPEVINILKKKGFKVKYETHRNESHYLISWKKE